MRWILNEIPVDLPPPDFIVIFKPVPDKGGISVLELVIFVEPLWMVVDREKKFRQFKRSMRILQHQGCQTFHDFISCPLVNTNLESCNQIFRVDVRIQVCNLEVRNSMKQGKPDILWIYRLVLLEPEDLQISAQFVRPVHQLGRHISYLLGAHILEVITSPFQRRNPCLFFRFMLVFNSTKTSLCGVKAL